MERWEEHKNGRGVLMGKSKERHRLENIGVDWEIILKWVLKKYDVDFLIWIHGANEGLL